MIRLMDISVERRRRQLLEGVTCHLNAGEIVAVIGRNGAGKSTLVKVAAGEIAPDRGTVKLDSRPLAAWPRRLLARRRAVLPQHLELAFPLTVAETVQLGRAPWEASRSCDERATAEAMRLAEIDDLRDRDMRTLSGGERQRAHLARVLAQILDPADSLEGRFLLLDEPTAALDLAHRAALFRLLRRLAEKGLGILCVLHEIDVAFRLADRLLLLTAGRLTADGPPGMLADADRLAAAFGVSFDIRADHRGRPVVVPE